MLGTGVSLVCWWGWGARGRGRRTKVVSCDHDAVFEFEPDDGGSGHDGLLGMLRWPGLGEVAGVVGAVDVVSGLEVGLAGELVAWLFGG
jgi:hypothetical protein